MGTQGRSLWSGVGGGGGVLASSAHPDQGRPTCVLPEVRQAERL